MSDLPRAVARFLGLWVLLIGVETLERVAYRAGVVDEAARHGVDPDEPLPPKQLRDVDDDLAAADVSDVVLLHVKTFHGPDAPRAGECAC